MSDDQNAELLKDPEVIREIERYKWIESEKAGVDVGFDKAAQDWLNLYAKGWVRHHAGTMKKTARSPRRIY